MCTDTGEGMTSTNAPCGMYPGADTGAAGLYEGADVGPGLGGGYAAPAVECCVWVRVWVWGGCVCGWVGVWCGYRRARVWACGCG